MRTVVLGPPPAELEAFLSRRRELGLDAYDEVWEGVVHVPPMAHAWHGMVQASLLIAVGGLAVRAGLEPCGPFNLGAPDDFRIPDAGVFDAVPQTAFVATALLVVEVISPDDETFEKFDFYTRAGVREVLTADPQERRVRIWRLEAQEPIEVEECEVLGTTAAELTAAVRWPSLTPPCS
ncbi:MAG: Uma2 family endonuclease [Actinomycetota bacterium]|nr:Uma2 family endonuclease [Actinomycetota bacterium]